ncbi:MAG: hypothetical protein ACKVPX_14780 [Myxococcaceae bacterium]
MDGANTRVVSLGDNIFGIAREFWKKAIETGGTGQGFPKESRPIDVKPPQVRPIDVKPREVNTAPDGSKTYRTPEGFILPAELPELPPRKK